MVEDIDIESAVALAEAETGIRVGKTSIRVCSGPGPKSAKKWTKEEDAFIRENLGQISEEDIAKQLRRTKTAVHVHLTRELHLVMPMKNQSSLSAEHVAMGLGIDGKSVHLMMDRKLMPMRLMPAVRKIRMVDRVMFMKWLLDPSHWLYFKPERVGAMRPRGIRGITEVYDFAFWEEAGELLMSAVKRWDDVWLTPSGAAAFLNMDGSSMHNINAAIRTGNLKATRWGNWRILKSDLPAGKQFNANGRIVEKIRTRGDRR